MKRLMRCLVALLALVVVVALAAEVGIVGSKKVHISFLHHWTGTDPKAQSFEPALKAFQEKNPDVELEILPMPGGKSETRVKLQTAFAAGAAPDVFLFDGGNAIEPYVKAGKLADLTDAVAKDPDFKNRFVPGTLDLVTFNGRLYGLPLELWTEHLFVNTRLMAKYKLSMPKTYSEFKEMVAAFKKNGIIPITFANKGGMQGRYFYSIFLAILSDANLIKNACEGTKGAKFTDKPFIRTAEVLAELSRMGAYPQGVNGITRDIAVSFFNDEKAAIYVDGPTAGGLILPDLQRDVRIMPYPVFPGETPNPDALVSFPANFIEVNADTAKDPARFDAAMRLVKHLSSTEVMKEMVELSSHLTPVRNVPYDRSKIAPLLAQILDLLARAEDTRWHINTSIHPAVYTKFNDAIANMLDAIGTPESNMKMVQDKMDEVTAQQK